MLIIYAHPNKDGHCGYMLKKAVESLEKSSTPYEILDLYEINYDPVLKPNELYSSQKRETSEQTLNFQEKIKSNDKLIFIYPTWWNCPPAILKGFIDRVFTSGFAFYYKDGRPKPLLTGKKAVVLSSAGGPSFLWINTGAVRFLTKSALKFCGIESKGFLINKAIKLDDKQMVKIERAVARALAYLS